MSVILDGKRVAAEILEGIKKEVSKMEVKPKLAVIFVGNNPSSEIYVKSKEKKCAECGFDSLVIRMREETTHDELLEVIEKLNKDESINGILLQLPLPKHLNSMDFIEKITPEKDVDGFHPINMGKLSTGLEPYAYPCTPKGVITLLKYYNIELEGKLALIIGRSNIVGKPLGMLLLRENATVIQAHSKTKNLSELSKMADIIFCATGKPKLLTSDMIKEGAVVVDIGISRNAEGKIQGDVDFENVKNRAGFITPNPGGIGPMTIASLMENTLKLKLKS